MKALTFQAVEQVAVESTSDPVIEDGRDAIVRVELAGICGSDLHVFHGRETGLDIGTVMGHEFVGEIEEVGAQATNMKRGDRVLSPFTTNCGICWYCRSGLTSRCEDGELFGWREADRGLHGGQAEFVRVPLADSTLVEIPEGTSGDSALLAGDNLATGFFCARQGGIEGGSSVAVVGCGAVGLMAILAARSLGAEKVFAVDLVGERLRLASRFGARAVDPTSEPVRDIVDEATAGRGVDVVLEAVGNEAATRTAIDLVRPGGTISAVGVHTEPTFSFSPVEAYDKNLSYKTGRCPARNLLKDVLPRLADDFVLAPEVISHRLTLDEGPYGYDLFAKRQQGCIKALLRL